MTSPSTGDALRAALAEVELNGAPAQSEHARAVALRLSQDSGDVAAREEALLLLDAFQNDPYLWR